MLKRKVKKLANLDRLELITELIWLSSIGFLLVTIVKIFILEITEYGFSYILIGLFGTIFYSLGMIVMISVATFVFPFWLIPALLKYISNKTRFNINSTQIILLSNLIVVLVLGIDILICYQDYYCKSGHGPVHNHISWSIGMLAGNFFWTKPFVRFLDKYSNKKLI